MKKLIYFIFTSALAAQVTVNVPSITVSNEAASSIQKWMQTQTKIQDITSLSSNITASQTTLPVIDSSRLVVGDALLWEQEVTLVTSIPDTTSIVVTRGTLGSTNTTHVSGTKGNVLKYPTVAKLFRQIIVDSGQAILASAGSPSIDAQKTAITNAEKAIADFKTGAVQ